MSSKGITKNRVLIIILFMDTMILSDSTTFSHETTFNVNNDSRFYTIWSLEVVGLLAKEVPNVVLHPDAHLQHLVLHNSFCWCY